MKKTKILVGRDLIGRFTCDGKKYTKFQTFVNETKRMVKTAVIVSVASYIIGLATYGAASYEHYTTAPQTAEAQTFDHSDKIFQAKIESLKDGVVNDIYDCERAGHVESDGLTTFDPQQGETRAYMFPSYGTMQFKQSTVQTYMKSIRNEIVNGKDAIFIALDDAKAKSLAKDIMFKTKAMASGDWTKCAAKTNADERILLIKQMEK